ncbi:hypothetical protein A2U01_0107103, partial [Trifolium medium]|nr:hypothetical protein [Trifolium medium]
GCGGGCGAAAAAWAASKSLTAFWKYVRPMGHSELDISSVSSSEGTSRRWQRVVITKG